MGIFMKPISAMLIISTSFHAGCVHVEVSEQAQRTKLEVAAEKALIDRAGRHFESVKCMDLECTFEYSMLVENSAAKIANDTESDLAGHGFSSVKINPTESLSSAFSGAILFGVGMGLAAAIFAAFQL